MALRVYRRPSLVAGVTLFAVVAAGCGGRARNMLEGSAQVSNEQVLGGGAAARPPVIYVADFTVAPGTIKPESGVVSEVTQAVGERPRLLGGGLLGGPLGGSGGIGQRVLGDGTTPEQVVEILATSITDSLDQQRINVPAERLPPGPLPASGWLVQGRFLSVDPGNRAQRAVIGFGAGEATAEVAVEVDQLGPGGITPIARFGTEAESGKAPGAAVTMNPYAAAAKFVLAKGATSKDVRNMGTEIAKRVAALVAAQSPR